MGSSAAKSTNNQSSGKTAPMPPDELSVSMVTVSLHREALMAVPWKESKNVCHHWISAKNCSSSLTLCLACLSLLLVSMMRPSTNTLGRPVKLACEYLQLPESGVTFNSEVALELPELRHLPLGESQLHLNRVYLNAQKD